MQRLEIYGFCSGAKRGYFYESVGGVYYTLDWPHSRSSGGSSSSSNHEEMAPNVNNHDDSGTHSMPHQEIAKDSSPVTNIKSNGTKSKLTKIYKSPILDKKIDMGACINHVDRILTPPPQI